MIRKLIILFDIVVILCYIFSLNPSLSSINYDKDTNTSSIDITFIKDQEVEDISIYNEALKELPYEILLSFKEDGWSIYLKSHLEDAAGLTNYDEKIIYINTSLKGQEKNTIIHEFGHFKDYTLDFASGSDKFLDLYSRYQDSYVEFDYLNAASALEGSDEYEYATYNKREFFATCFKDFILHPTYLKDTYPELYTYMKKLT